MEQRQALVRERLVSEAATLVSDGGWASCSISTVAARAGVATGTVYGYFASKAELLAEVFRTISSREIAAALDVGQQVREDRDACACEVILETVGMFAERAAQAPRLAYAVLAEPVDVAVDLERLAFRRAWTDLLAVAVREGVGREQLPAQDPQVTASAVLGAAAEVLVQPLAAGAVEPDAYAAVVQSLRSFIRRCLGGDHEHHA